MDRREGGGGAGAGAWGQAGVRCQGWQQADMCGARGRRVAGQLQPGQQAPRPVAPAAHHAHACRGCRTFVNLTNLHVAASGMGAGGQAGAAGEPFHAAQSGRGTHRGRHLHPQAASRPAQACGGAGTHLSGSCCPSRSASVKSNSCTPALSAASLNPMVGRFTKSLTRLGACSSAGRRQRTA